MDTKTEGPPSEPTSPEAGTPSEQAERPDFDSLLTHLDSYLTETPELRAKFRASRTAMGIAGELAAREREVHDQATARQAIEDAHAQMRTLAAEDPEGFAQKWLSADDVKTIRQREAGLRDTTRREFAKGIGDALQDLPEFKELTAEDTQRIASSVANLPEDKVVGAFVKAAVDVVSDRRSHTKAEAAYEKRLAEDKKVWEREQADKRRSERPRPSLAMPSNGSARDSGEPANHLSPEWAAWDEAQRKAGAGMYARR